MKTLCKIVVAVMLVLSLGGVPAVHATTITLSDLNSEALIDADLQSGMHSWTVDGVQMMSQQWFWYGIGDAPEQSINTISAANVDLHGGTNSATLQYENAVMAVDVNYAMFGGAAGSGTADISEMIRITNRSNTALDLHFFQYSDFDLGGAFDTVQVMDGNRVRQWDVRGILTETVVTPAASRYEANLWSNTLTSLNNGTPTILSNAAGPISGDVTWAYQWDRTIGVGGTLLISKDKNIVPVAVAEPSVLLLLGAGLVGLGILRKKI